VNARIAKRRAMTLIDLIWLITILTGAWIYFYCKTCHGTSPEVFLYLKLYLLFICTVWTLQFSVLFGFVALIFWMHRNGLLETGGGQVAARKDLITEIATVPYSPDLFAGGNGQCCVCQEDFGSDKPIKRTPCGHFFHEDCLGGWLGDFAKTCPLCRSDLEAAVDQQGQPTGPQEGVHPAGAQPPLPPPDDPFLQDPNLPRAPQSQAPQAMHVPGSGGDPGQAPGDTGAGVGALDPGFPKDSPYAQQGLIAPAAGADKNFPGPSRRF